MQVTLAYIEEPPFGWTDPKGAAVGADIELAEQILTALGIFRIEYRPTTFAELLPGVEAGRWDMNVPLFVTPERAERVAFSRPVWSIGDGFLVRSGNPKSLDSYVSLVNKDAARLGVIAGQVQYDSALAFGVREEQIVIFEQQSEAIDALRAGVIDAYASTSVGNRILADRLGRADFEAVTHEDAAFPGRMPPVGAFSFNRKNISLLSAVNEQLRRYLGSRDHRARMAKWGLTNHELEPVMATLF